MPRAISKVDKEVLIETILAELQKDLNLAERKAFMDTSYPERNAGYIQGIKDCRTVISTMIRRGAI